MACGQESGIQGYALSKSLQGMGDLVFSDLASLAPRGLWPKETTLTMLTAAAEVAERLPVMLPGPYDGNVQNWLALPNAESLGQARRDVIARLRRLREDLAKGDEWPPIAHHHHHAM